MIRDSFHFVAISLCWLPLNQVRVKTVLIQNGAHLMSEPVSAGPDFNAFACSHAQDYIATNWFILVVSPKGGGLCVADDRL